MFEFKVEGMTCGSCASAITRAIRDNDPEAQVTVDIRQQKARVKTAQKQEEVAQLIEEAGYKVLEVGEVTD